MKLATFTTEDNTKPRVGIVIDDSILDLSQLSGLPATMKAILADGEDSLAKIRDYSESAT